MRKFEIAALEFSDDQVAITVIREVVMPDDSLISKVETYTVARASLSASVVQSLNDFVERVMHDYSQGLESLSGLLAEAAPDDDSDSIEVR